MVGKISRGLIILLLLFCISCHKQETTSNLKVRFSIQVDGADLIYHSLEYQNDAGNPYQVDEVKFFISELKFYQKGEWQPVASQKGLHYYDSNLPDTWNWLIENELNIGPVDSVTFVFGLLDSKNITGFFPNAPENNMSWPDYMGGGYHYMQINGKWKTPSDSIRPFNLHTGIGQIYEGGQLVEFVQNYFIVTLPTETLSIHENTENQMDLVMNVNNWFRSPHQFDWNQWGGAIMQNQAAQQCLKENGTDVFSVR